jgi:hypothetical protein
VLPADQVEALECLVDEVEQVPAIGERPLGRNREQREQSALGRLAMAHVCPAPQPAFERRRIWSASKRGTFPPRRLAIAVRRHAARAVEQGEISLLLWQQGEEIGQGR